MIIVLAIAQVKPIGYTSIGDNMVRIRYLAFVLLIFWGMATGSLAQHPEADWETVGNGIEYRHFQLTDPPNQVFVARMDRNNPNVTIESSIAQGKLNGGLESVSGMAERYDQALNYWGSPTIPVSQTWGSRNQVVVAINGHYYDPGTGIPWFGQIHSGWYAKRHPDWDASGFVWKMDRSVFIGQCVTHPPDKQYVDFANDQIQELQGVNTERGQNQLILYTPQYGRDTGTDDDGVEVLVEMETPTYIALAQDVPFGIVRQIYKNQGSTPIPFDHIVLSAQGAAAQTLFENVHEGDRIGIAQKVKDCLASPQQDWTRAYAGVGGDFYFLKGGIIDQNVISKENAIVRAPRTAIAYNENYIFFIVVDGRFPGYSEGMTIEELAKFAKSTLGASYGIALDGGGSSTMVINGEVVNHPSDCYFRVYLPLVSSVGAESGIESTSGEEQPTEISSAASQYSSCERRVANGMMMVVVEPIQQSEGFSPGSYVTTLKPVNVYLGPGTNYQVLEAISAGVDGSVVSHFNELDGVLAKGSYWWKVDFGNTIGWVAEENLDSQLKRLVDTWTDSAYKTR
jgi:hypothetical protein